MRDMLRKLEEGRGGLKQMDYSPEEKWVLVQKMKKVVNAAASGMGKKIDDFIETDPVLRRAYFEFSDAVIRLKMTIKEYERDLKKE